MPKFNRERLVIEVLHEGRAVLIQWSLDNPGVMVAGRRIGEALEHPFGMSWDPNPPCPAVWEWDRELLLIRREAIERHRRGNKP
jgi:hypothetical protein